MALIITNNDIINYFILINVNLNLTPTMIVKLVFCSVNDYHT